MEEFEDSQLRDYKPSVVVDKLADLPKEYITYIEDVKADKKKLEE